ncbi:MAG: amidohydrolase family protein, partial [Oscillospiraceae bacterium]|nr:amidohydrolase family protein [Oscillospiraceae bacterium]
CPSSNLKLASGIAPIKKYLDSGINVALGTDGAASNNALDMFNEVRLAALLHKGATGNPTAITAQTAIEMATVNGAKALGRENEIGKIAKGYKADLIFIETKSANMQPLATSLCSAIAYSASSKNITHTIISGEIKYIK